MIQRPSTPEIGSFNVVPDRNGNSMLPPMPSNTAHEPIFNGGGEEAIRKFMGNSAPVNTSPVCDPFYPALPGGTENAVPVTGPALNIVEQIDDLQSQAESLSKSPDVTYTDRLKKHNISIDRAKEIVDAILFKGEYQETYQLTQKHTVTFKSRMFSDQERALRALESLSPQYPASMAAIVSKNNLAASIVRFAGRDFTKLAFKDKAEYIEKLPEPLVRLLAIKLGKFDQMIMDIMDDGVIENF